MLLGHGGDWIDVRPAYSGLPRAIPGPVTDHGDGTYSFDLLATSEPGRGAWHLVVDFGGAKPRTLWPPLAVHVDPLVDLHVGFSNYGARSALVVPFVINRGPLEAGRSYRILGSFSGSAPGVDFGGVHLPLNRDHLFQLTWSTPGGPPFRGSVGILDALGRGQAGLELDPVAWATLIGERLEFCALLGGPNPEVTSLTSFTVHP